MSGFGGLGVVVNGGNESAKVAVGLNGANQSWWW